MLTMPFSKTCSEILRVNRCLSLGRDGEASKYWEFGYSMLFRPCYTQYRFLFDSSRVSWTEGNC